DIKDPFTSSCLSQPASPANERTRNSGIQENNLPETFGYQFHRSNWSRSRSSSASSSSSVETAIYSPEKETAPGDTTGTQEIVDEISSPTRKPERVSPFRRYRRTPRAVSLTAAAKAEPGHQPAAPTSLPGTLPVERSRSHSLAVSPHINTGETATTIKTSTSTAGRRRARSNSIRGDNPAAVPISPQEQDLAALVRSINEANAREAEAAARKEQVRRRYSIDARISELRVGESERLGHDLFNDIQARHAAAKAPTGTSTLRPPRSPGKGIGGPRQSALETVQETHHTEPQQAETEQAEGQKTPVDPETPPPEVTVSDPAVPAAPAPVETKDTSIAQALWKTLKEPPQEQTANTSEEGESHLDENPPVVPPEALIQSHNQPEPQISRKPWAPLKPR
ncbi:hypothetical protein F5884DRAFT_732093, partial [Xylogone sp. PMI_703]